jgi:hypothetical protein
VTRVCARASMHHTPPSCCNRQPDAWCGASRVFCGRADGDVAAGEKRKRSGLLSPEEAAQLVSGSVASYMYAGCAAAASPHARAACVAASCERVP